MTRWGFIATNPRPHSAVRPLNQPAPSLAFGHETPRLVAIDQEGHPDMSVEPIRVTAKEAQTLQSYPRDFEFKGARTKQYLQIGNAVPVLLARAVLEALWAKPVVDNVIAFPTPQRHIVDLEVAA